MNKSHQLPFWGRLETLWLLIAPLCAAIYALCQPLSPNDLWYHVRAGELINRLGTVPKENLMSFGVPFNEPFYYQSWLAELTLFKALQFGGLSGLQLLRAFCLTAAIALITIATFRFILRHQKDIDEESRLKSARFTAIATIWGFLMLSNNLDLRPQTFSVLLCGLWIFSLLEFDKAVENPKKALPWALTLCLLLLIWANTHGAFILGILSLVGFTIGKCLLRRPEAKYFAGLTLICSLAGLINPRGLELYRYVLLLSNNTIGQKYIQEWGSPDLSEWHNWLFFLSLPLLALAFFGALKKKKSLFAPLLPLLVVLTIVFIMGMRDIRSIIWFALFLAPVLAFALTKSFEVEKSAENSTTSPAKPVARGAAVMNLVLILLLLCLPLSLFPGIKPSIPWPDDFKSRFAPTPQRLFPNDPPLLLDRTTPVEAVEYWATHPPRTRVFTDMVCGSYMTWATYPQIQPLCEPRIELFATSFWEKYVQISNGDSDVKAYMEKWGCKQALVDKATQKQLIQKLRNLGWEQRINKGSTILLEKSE